MSNRLTDLLGRNAEGYGDLLGRNAEQYGPDDATRAYVHRGDHGPTVVATGPSGTAVHGPAPVDALDAAGLEEADAWLLGAPESAALVGSRDRPISRLTFDEEPEIGERVDRLVTGDRLTEGEGAVTRGVADAAGIERIETVDTADDVGPFTVEWSQTDARPGCVRTRVETTEGAIRRERGEDGARVTVTERTGGRGR